MFAMGRKARITREAEAWVVRTSDGLSAADRSERDAWRAADPDHERAWQKLQLIWGTTEVAARRAASALRPPSVRPRPYAVAIAGVAGVLVAGGGAFLLHPGWQRGHASKEWAAARSGRHIVMADGTGVDLAPASAIRVDLDGPIRAVLLERGRARFDVAHDPRHPFVVSAADRRVTAIGTRFEVALQPKGVIVTLFQGTIEVAEQNAKPQHLPVRMSQGQRLTVQNNAETLAQVDATANSGAAPQDVSSTALGSIIAMANHGAAIPIRLADPALAARRIEGRFSLGDTGALAQQLAAALDLEVTRQGNAYLLSAH